MIRRTFLALVLTALTALAPAAQSTPQITVDYQALARLVNDDPAAYRALLDRFISADATLTPQEVATVYYGYVFTPGYSPTHDFSRINELRAERRYAELLPVVKAALEENPVSLPLLFRCFAAAYHQGDDALKANVQTRVNQLCDVIFASGNGVTQESPFMIVCADDAEPFLINYVQVDNIEGSSQSGPMKVAKTTLSYRDEPVYFYFLPYRPLP